MNGNMRRPRFISSLSISVFRNTSVRLTRGTWLFRANPGRKKSSRINVCSLKLEPDSGVCLRAVSQNTKLGPWPPAPACCPIHLSRPWDRKESLTFRRRLHVLSYVLFSQDARQICSEEYRVAPRSRLLSRQPSQTAILNCFFLGLGT